MQNRILRSYSAADSPWKTAVMAGYEGARQNKSFNAPTRVGSNPNSSIAQLQRSRLSLQGEEIVKNTAFGRNLINRRRAYCSSGITYHADTGDSALNKLVTDYCVDQWKRMGVNQSMQQTFGICADAMLPQYGDCALRWIRSEIGNPKSELRLLAITGDRIGEVYRYVAPVTKDGKTYYCGLFFDGPNIVSYRIYERWYDTTYTRPENVDAADVIFFIDPIDTGVRGVSLFSAAVDDIRSSHEILKATKDTMQQQSKMAAIASNNSGSAMDYSYDQQTNTDGRIEYQESYADGAVVKYQFNGDSYQVLRAEHPSQDFVAALRYLDQRGSLACGFPYEFLFSGSESGGAPFRGAFEIAGREIERLRNQVHRPRLDVIAYVTIMDGVERGLLPAKAGITRGNWQFTTLPSADAFRDAKSDIDQIRAGITSPQRVIANNLGTTADAILSETREWAIMVSKTVEDANRELVKQGYKPTVTAQDVAQVSDNPQSAAQAENLLDGKPTTISDSSTKSDTVEQTGAAPKPAAAMAFDEGKHPRADDGKFGSGGGAKADAPEPAKGDKPAQSGGGKGGEDDGIDSKISNVRDGKGSMEFFHGTSMRDADLHIGKTFTDNQTTADNYAAEKTFQGNVDLNGLKIAKVKRFDREDANYGAVGDSNSDIADLQDRGIDLIEYDDEDPSGREHSAYRIVSDKALDRFKDGVSLRDNRIHSLANDLSENELIGKTKEDVLEKIKTLSVEDIFKMAVEHEPDNDEEFVTRIFKDAGVKLPAKYVAKMADWDESKHKRADDGKFGEGGGGAKADAPEPAKGDKPAQSGGGKGDEMGEGADGKPKKVSEMSKGEKKTHDMRKKLEALRAKNAEGAQKLAAINARTADLHKQLVEQLKTGTGTANDDLKKTVNELGAKIAETEMQTKSIQHALRGEDIAADERGQDSPEHDAARKRTEYVADKAK